MKKLFIAAIITFAAISCSKDKTQQVLVKDEESVIRIESVTASNDSESRLQMFNLLSSSEKFTLWYNHLVKAKQQYVIENNTSKAQLIDELIANFTSSLFDDNSQSSIVFLSYFVPTWYANAQSVFSEQELFDIINNPDAVVIGGLAAPIEIGGGDIPAASCFCNVGTTGFSCKKTVVGTGGVTITNGVCERNSNECNESRRGCGWFWLSACNGNHCNFG